MRPTRANLVLEGRPGDAPQACSCRCRAVLRAARGARVALRQRSTALQLHDGSKGCTLWLSARRGRRRPARSAGPRRCRSSWLLWSRGWNSACVARCAQVFFFRRVRFFSGSDKGPGSRSGLGLRRLPAGLRKHAQRCGKGWPAVGCSRLAASALCRSLTMNGCASRRRPRQPLHAKKSSTTSESATSKARQLTPSTSVTRTARVSANCIASLGQWGRSRCKSAPPNVKIGPQRRLRAIGGPFTGPKGRQTRWRGGARAR